MQEIKGSGQESSAPGSTVEEIQAWISLCVREGIGRIRCRCKEPIHPEAVGMYPHVDGLEIRGKGRQWVFIHCPRCGYDWSLWKLGMGLDGAREIRSAPG